MKRIICILFNVFFITNAFALVNETIPNACGVAYPKIHAVFTPSTYICAQGYFLPANTDGCRPCPVDHICNGGTFQFNERQSQGIVYKDLTRNTPNACASNFVHNLGAVFYPNTLNLVFDDNNGNTSNTTCSYDGLITLPDEPSRPGYVFRGWQLQNTGD